MVRLSASLRKIACNRKAMDESIQMLKRAILEARVEDKEKTRSLQRFRRFVPDNTTHQMKFCRRISFHSSTVIACVGHDVTHAMHAMQSLSRTGTDF